MIRVKAPQHIVIASRASALAMWQARHVQRQLLSHYPACRVDILSMSTRGDEILDRSLSKIGGKGLFVKELENALESGAAHIAVHSMKDVPMVLPEGYAIAAIGAREDPRDALVSNRCTTLVELPAGARIGTSSQRREAQLRARFPALNVLPLRGNVQTRLRKLDDGDFDAIILAAAGLIRLNLAGRIRCYLSPEESLPAPGQGALGIECLASRGDLLDVLRPLQDDASARAVRAERALSRSLGGSCQIPLGAYAEAVPGALRLRGFVAFPDGRELVFAEASALADDPEALGMQVAELLRVRGAGRIIAALDAVS
jgi:hydroxymethylbilane synthase